VQKLTELRDAMKSKQVTALVISALDQIAWLYNIRGADVPCNPVAISYALITNGRNCHVMI
jgi:Xaa-Pro aminopeptidase